MKLTELFLNRFLYRDTSQNLETKDSAFISADSTPATPTPIASGSAAQDINTSNVFINGQIIVPGSYILTVGDWGWGQTCVFSSTDLNTVAWTGGTFKPASGTPYTILAGTTDARLTAAGFTSPMNAKTYIYLDLNLSETVYQCSYTAGDSVGIGKVLIAVAQNSAVASPQPNATFNTTEANQIVGDNILANTINASKIVAGSITAVQMTAATINAMNIVAGSVAAENITGTTITGKTIQTASSGIKIILDASTDSIKFGDSTYASIIPYIGASYWGLLGETSVGSSYWYIQEYGTGAESAGLGTSSSSIEFYNDTCDITGTFTVNGSAIVSMDYPGAGIPISTGSGWSSSITNNSSNWNNALLKSGGTMTGNITMPGAGYYINFSDSYIDNVNTIYFDTRQTAPGAAEGALYYDSLSGTLQVYDGSNWKEVAYV